MIRTVVLLSGITKWMDILFLLSYPCFSFYVFSCRCWLRSLNIALYSSVGYRLKCAVSNSSFSYSAGFMFLLLVMKRTYCSTFPTAASAMAVKASELCKWFRTISCNKWICNCIYQKCSRGCFPSKSKQCEILSGAHKNTPRGVQNKIQQTHTVSLRYGIYMTHNARDAKASI